MVRGVLTRYLTLCIFATACRSQEITNATPPTPSAAESTTIVVSEPLDAAVPDCTVHLVSDAFSPTHASPAGTVRVDGDYMHALAKVSIERPGVPAWSGTFSGPREAFFDFVRKHLCTEAHVYVLKPEGNKDPTKGPVSLAAFDMKPDEKSDVESVCNANRAVDAGSPDMRDPDVRDRVMMQWVEDVVTTTKWDGWRRSFARERGDLMASKQPATALFHARGENLANAAHALGIKSCPVADDWKKR